MLAKDIAAVIEELAPLKYQENWDNAGFCVGSPEAEVTGALLCVDVTPEILDEAIARGFNMVISHHPVIFHGLKKLTGASFTERVVAQAVKNNLVLYAAHTNLDNVPHGVNWALAAKLGLQEITLLQPGNAPEAGSGAIGALPAPMPVEQWLAHLKHTFSLPVIRHSRWHTAKVQRIALCGGSGAFLMGAAIAAGADCFVSAEFKYNHFFDVQNQLIIADIGHYESEKCVLTIFFNLLTKKMPNFALQIAEKISNPVIYS